MAAGPSDHERVDAFAEHLTNVFKPHPYEGPEHEKMVMECSGKLQQRVPCQKYTTKRSPTESACWGHYSTLSTSDLPTSDCITTGTFADDTAILAPSRSSGGIKNPTGWP
ncbi:hypothetical protein EVAR_77270_1 [Eumeta japonica]|uniref:Uncharacterized protein n=1 Tax=Eumeta variegata TaxID=151549 RepID=A0A4C1UMN7_EUMVA|nr:hypothetical protein EVAR_77270_1 [Eumeta japonica]